jgi:RNA polymerase sigma-70 factor (ECF subfamily)
MTTFDAEELLKDGARLRALASDLVRGATGVGGDVDELVQETWLRALAKPVRAGFSPRAWFAGLARNVARERRRAERRREDHERAAAPSLPSSGSSADDPAEVAARFDLLRRLLSFVDALAEPQRTTLIRRYVDGLEPAVIARRDGVPDATVRSRIKRGLDELRARLDAERGGDRSAWMAVLLPWSRPSAVAATAVVFEGLALKWIAFAAAGVLALTGVAVVAAGPKSGHDDPTQVAARPRAAQDVSPASSLAPPAEAAVRVVDPAGSAAADRSVDGARTKAGWRIEGRLLGLDPSTPWTGTIRVVPIGNGVDEFSDGPQGVGTPLVEGRFAADLAPPAAASGVSAPWRAWQVTASDPAYVDVRALVARSRSS